MSVEVRVDAGVAEVTLNRPQVMNAIDPETRAELVETWRRIDQDADIRVGLLTGAGDRAFCAGADLKKSATPDGSAAAGELGGEATYLLQSFPKRKPMVCAVNGIAVGGGLELALACDIRIAATSAQFALSEVRIGSIPGAGGTQNLPRVVGSGAAMYMGLTGERVDAAWALRVGLVTEVLAAEDLFARGREIADRIAINAPLAVRAVKHLMSESSDVPLRAGLQSERLAFGLLRDSEDRLEGRRAFMEKRAPEFRGR